VIHVPRKSYLSNHPSHFMSTKFLLIKNVHLHNVRKLISSLYKSIISSKGLFSSEEHLCLLRSFRLTLQQLPTHNNQVCKKSNNIAQLLYNMHRRVSTGIYCSFFTFLQLQKLHNLPTTSFTGFLLHTIWSERNQAYKYQFHGYWWTVLSYLFLIEYTFVTLKLECSLSNNIQK
jgi:hypothetical protein